MNPMDIIDKYYEAGSLAHDTLIVHSAMVTEKALDICYKNPDLKVDVKFIEEAALLHDIGVCKTFAPGIGCYGTLPYICHGYKGHDMLVEEGYPKHALVCERHTGTGIGVDQIIENDLPLPKRDLYPITTEEVIICFADKFYTKGDRRKELTIDEIIHSLSRFGQSKVDTFKYWCKRFL